MELMYTQKGKEPQLEVDNGQVAYSGHNEMTLPDHIGEKAAADIAQAMGLTYYMLRSADAKWYNRNLVEEAIYVSPALREKAEEAKFGLAGKIKNMLNYLAGEQLYEDAYREEMVLKGGESKKQIVLQNHESGVHFLRAIVDVSVDDRARFTIDGNVFYLRFDDEGKTVSKRHIWIGSLLQGRSNKQQINRVGIIRSLGEECPYALLESFMDKATINSVVESFNELCKRILAAQEDARNYEAFKTLREIAR